MAILLIVGGVLLIYLAVSDNFTKLWGVIWSPTTATNGVPQASSGG